MTPAIEGIIPRIKIILNQCKFLSTDKLRFFFIMTLKPDRVAKLKIVFDDKHFSENIQQGRGGGGKGGIGLGSHVKQLQ